MLRDGKRIAVARTSDAAKAVQLAHLAVARNDGDLLGLAAEGTLVFEGWAAAGAMVIDNDGNVLRAMKPGDVLVPEDAIERAT